MIHRTVLVWYVKCGLSSKSRQRFKFCWTQKHVLHFAKWACVWCIGYKPNVIEGNFSFHLSLLVFCSVSRLYMRNISPWATPKKGKTEPEPSIFFPFHKNVVLACCLPQKLQWCSPQNFYYMKTTNGFIPHLLSFTYYCPKSWLVCFATFLFWNWKKEASAFLCVDRVCAWWKLLESLLTVICTKCGWRKWSCVVDSNENEEIEKWLFVDGGQGQAISHLFQSGGLFYPLVQLCVSVSVILIFMEKTKMGVDTKLNIASTQTKASDFNVGDILAIAKKN